MSETKESVRDTLEAVIDAAVETPSRSQERTRGESRTDSTAEPSDSRGKAQPPADREGEPDSSLVPPDGDRPRDQFGRFLSPSKTSEVREAAPPEESAAAEEENAPDQPADTASELGERQTIAPPPAWGAAVRDHWASLPRAIQEHILKRENEVNVGLQERAERINALEPIAQALAPYQQKMALRGINATAAIGQLLAVQDMLERDPIGGVAYVARSYGVDLRQFATAFEQAQRPQNPEVAAVQKEISELKGFLAQQKQAMEQAGLAQANTEIEAFGADPAHPYFTQVRQAMGQLFTSGMASTLQEAYDHACWAIPEVRSRILEDQKRQETAARVQADKQAAERARRAAVSVTGAPSGNGASQPSAGRPGKNSVRSDIEAALNQVASV